MANPYQNGAGLLHNKFGITDVATLNAVEYDISQQRANDMLENDVFPDIQGYGLARLQAIHRYLFQDLYEWAGKMRTVPYSKLMDNGLTSVFAPPHLIEPKWQALERETQNFLDNQHMNFEEKVAYLTEIFIQANHLHPFPEGNGRSLQVFMQQLAKEQGVYLDYSKNIAEKWNEASGVSSVHGKVETDTDGSKFMIPEPPNKEPIRQIFITMASPIL